ncbi:MAG TPA: alpha/beta hydrolase [Thermoanaerobaculia bacterium]|jgi:pimeloyl-ACP methyl ester carboxylesterase|nr:alpha/beta hydrolase [Thermoanaerobaculia bacterium]
MRRTLLAALIVMAWNASGQEAWQPFTLRSFDNRATSGESRTLAVRENRRDAASRFIRIGVVRLRGGGGTPTIFLSGGPGIPATVLARVPVYFDLFERLRKAGDVLLIDQRGSGMSLPNLTCPTAELTRDGLATDENMRQLLLRRVTRCAAFWRAGGVDLRGYSTREITDDIDAVRRAIGAQKVNLLAFSYGSEVAIEIARRRPESVRRIVFASTRAPDTLLKSPAVWDRQLDTLGIREEVREVVARLDREPVKAAELTLGGIALLTALRNDLPDGRATGKIAPLVHATRDADYAPLAQRARQTLEGIARSFNLMTLAVDCSSGWSARRLADTRAEAAGAVMRTVNLQWDAEICAAIAGAGTPPPIGRITVPALFITGTLDPNAPVAQTDAIRRRFTNSVHVTVVNGAHETLPAAEVQERVAAFLRGEPESGERIVVGGYNAPPP